MQKRASAGMTGALDHTSGVLHLHTMLTQLQYPPSSYTTTKSWEPDPARRCPCHGGDFKTLENRCVPCSWVVPLRRTRDPRQNLKIILSLQASRVPCSTPPTSCGQRSTTKFKHTVSNHTFHPHPLHPSPPQYTLNRYFAEVQLVFFVASSPVNVCLRLRTLWEPCSRPSLHSITPRGRQTRRIFMRSLWPEKAIGFWPLGPL